jgi:hypothetical protein
MGREQDLKKRFILGINIIVMSSFQEKHKYVHHTFITIKGIILIYYFLQELNGHLSLAID